MRFLTPILTLIPSQYGIEGVYTVKGIKLVILHNPHGKGEWCGAFSDKDEFWTPELRDQVHLPHGAADDGKFVMSFDDFCKQA